MGQVVRGARRNRNAIHIGLTATPRQLRESSDKAIEEDEEITANNHQYFGEPVYEYTLIQAQEDGYLAACEIVKRKATIDSASFHQEGRASPPRNPPTSRPATLTRRRPHKDRIHRQGL